MSPERPLLRWRGGKWALAPWILDHMPPHQIYTEAFGGAASVLMRKPRCAGGEVLNDIDHEVVELFRVLRAPELAARLVEVLKLTPFARAEREASAWPARRADIVERTRAFIVRTTMGGNYTCRGAQDWASYPEALGAAIDRLRGVVIENRDALDVMREHDGAGTLHYVDPPVRWRKRYGTGKRRELAPALLELDGMVMLSADRGDDATGRALAGWHRFDAPGDTSTESLWLNPAAVAARDRAALPLLKLFGAAP